MKYVLFAGNLLLQPHLKEVKHNVIVVNVTVYDSGNVTAVYVVIATSRTTSDKKVSGTFYLLPWPKKVPFHFPSVVRIGGQAALGVGGLDLIARQIVQPTPLDRIDDLLRILANRPPPQFIIRTILPGIIWISHSKPQPAGIVGLTVH